MAYRRPLLWWLPPVVWAAGIFALSSISFAPKPALLPGADKLVHAALFAVLAALVYLALRRAHGWDAGRAARTAFFLTLLYAALDELHQVFTPLRVPDVKDWLADGIGATAPFWRRRKPHRPS